MQTTLSLPVRVALWTSSIGMALFVARRLWARRSNDIGLGALSHEWLAQQRWPPADPLTI